MKFKILIVLSFIVYHVNAQITLTSGDIASAGDTVRFSTTASVIPQMYLDTAMGANKTWDFSMLVPNFQDMASFKTPLSLGVLYVTSFGSSTYGLPSSNAVLGALGTATNVLAFFTKSSSSYTLDGKAFTFSGLPISQPYTTKDAILKFPVNYGNKDTNAHSANAVSLSVVSMATSGKRINSVDGWGAITTPYGTYNCLRVKSLVLDTNYIIFGTTPISMAAISTEYRWFANGQKIPILEVVVPSTGTATIKYRDINRPSVFASLANFTANKTLFPVNTTTDTCTLTSSSANTPNSVQWTITPNTFTFTGGTSSTSTAAKIFFTAPGKYTVKLHAMYNAGSSDTIRTDYITASAGPAAKFSSNTMVSNNTTTVFFYDSSTGTGISKWQWSFVPNKVSFVGGSSAASQNPKVVFDSATSYSVTLKVTDSIGTNSVTKSNYILVYNTGIEEQSALESAIRVFPNPAHDVLNVEESLPAAYHVQQIQIFDIAGKYITDLSKTGNSKQWSVDCSSMTKGLYFVKISLDGNMQFTRKISVM